MKKKWVVEFIRTGVKLGTNNKKVENNSEKWVEKKLEEVYKDYDSIPSVFVRSNTLKEAFTREFRANELACKNDRKKAIEMSITNIKVYPA